MNYDISTNNLKKVSIYYMEPHIASKFYKFFISNIFETILGIKVYII
jgi:hypothetical protein